MTEPERLEQTGHMHAAQVVALAGNGDMDKFRDYVNQLDRQQMAWVIYSLTGQIVDALNLVDDADARCDEMEHRMHIAENANMKLFAEKRKLLTRLEELRAAVNRHAATAPRSKAA